MNGKWKKLAAEIPTIQPNGKEEKLFALFLEVATKYSPSTTVRVVGGWTRDKLLGRDPHDVDIMVDDISGAVFAKMITNHLGLKGPNVIKENPEKSKLIETAKVFLPEPWNQEVDVARCRKETYTKDSRIPSTSPATAEQDAARRDLTINTLFYNIHTRAIEDFTGLGLQDIRDQVIRAPGDPFVRFMEDPLRIFRAARFASRFGWEIEESTAAAMAEPEVKKALLTKTSPDRIGDELVTMLKEPHPDVGLEALQKNNYIHDLLVRVTKGTEYEGKMGEWNMSQNNVHHDLSL